MKNKAWFRKRKGFKSRDLGYGFVPISWQGWISTLFFILGFIFLFYYYGLFYENAIDPGLDFFATFTLWIIIFIFFAKSRSE